jgi:hypothetical protein
LQSIRPSGSSSQSVSRRGGCVTPQPGQQLTALSLQDESWASSSLGSWLDVAIASPVLSALQIGET